MSQQPQLIPYITSGGKEKNATVVPVNFSLEGLSDEEIQVIIHLSEASNGMTPIYAQQHYDRSLEIYKSLLDFEGILTDPNDKQLLEDYNTLFAARNSPWARVGGEGMCFPISRDKVPINHPLREFIELLIHGVQAPEGRGLYPSGITDAELSPLENKSRVNSSVIQNQEGSLEVVLHETRYERELDSVINSIKVAKRVTTNENLKNYLETKIKELYSGSLESREESFLRWFDLDGPIDFLIGTAVEPSMDKILGVRGSARSFVGNINNKYQDFCNNFLKILPELERDAPWKYKRENYSESNNPQLRFIDVANWSGDYDPFPLTVNAQSLPNEQDFKEKYGTINLVFVNIQEAISNSGGRKIIEELFLPRDIQEKYGQYLTDIYLKMTSAHELGHHSGGVAMDSDPNYHFGKEYTLMEEARGELFSMWALPKLVERHIITPEQELAGYYSIVISLIGSLQQSPENHSGAYNMMFHYFLQKGALVETKEGDHIKYIVNKNLMESSVSKMLGIIGDIKATGDREGFYHS